ncbi:hypothetical protein Tco_0474163 [Tanacetum coccineum]
MYMDFITGIPTSLGPLPTSFTAHKVSEVFLYIVVKLHGIPKTIMSDHDPIFIKVVNRGLEQYLRAMVSGCPHKLNLLAAKIRIEEQANQKITLAKRLSNKLAKRFYGSYEVVERIGKVAYRIALPITRKIHPVYHVLILKLFTGHGTETVRELPKEFQNGQPMEQLVAVCDSRLVLQNGGRNRQVGL